MPPTNSTYHQMSSPVGEVRKLYVGIGKYVNFYKLNLKLALNPVLISTQGGG